MKKHITAAYPPAVPPFARTMGLLVAVLFMLMALGQLFDFEDMPGTMLGGFVAAALVATGQVLALPFLLALRLSPLMRLVSALCGASAVVYWFYVALAGALGGYTDNTGLLGAHVMAPHGWWLVSFMLGVWLMFGWFAASSFAAGRLEQTRRK